MHNLLVVAVLSLALSSCAPVHRFMVAPHRTIRHYRHWRRTHERERRQEARKRTNVTWSKL
jgi:hypothetical protein